MSEPWRGGDGRARAVGEQKNESTAHFYLTSLRAAATERAGYIRGHWGIENGRHWCLDIAFRGDDTRARAGPAGANLGMIRRVALSRLKRADTKNRIRTRRMNAGGGHDYLLEVLKALTTD